MKIKNCKICNKEFTTNTSGKYCSHECQLEANRIKYKKQTTSKKCKICGMDFNGTRQQVNCQQCYRQRKPQWQFVKQKVLCKKCDSIVEEIDVIDNGLTKSIVKGNRLCVDCKQKSSEEIKKRMSSDANPSIQKYGRFKRGKISKYRNYTDEEIKNRLSDRMKKDNPMKKLQYVDKMRNTIKRKIKNGEISIPKGKLHWSWRGNRDKAQTIRNRLYKNWVYPILSRDNFSCVKCGRNKCRLEVHHNQQTFRDILNNALDLCDIKRLYSTSYVQFELVCQTVLDLHRDVDGVTVCVNCHKEIDNLRY